MMANARKAFAVHPGEILKTEFMEPMGLSVYALAQALKFPGVYEVVRGERAISADTAVHSDHRSTHGLSRVATHRR